MRILLTGASGFAGAHMLRYLLHNTDAEVVCPVTFRHKGTSSRLRWAFEAYDIVLDRVHIVPHDLTGPIDGVTAHHDFGPVDVVMNIASESHVDRSITDPVSFVRNNVDLQLNLLEYAKREHVQLFLQMSTDEVYGPASWEANPDGHEEWSPILPSNPYSASKAAQEAIAISYWRTYGVPLVLTNTMNLYGETQDPEKFFPLIMRHVFADNRVPIHVDGDGMPGSGFYLHAQDFAAAWWFLVQRYLAEGSSGKPPLYDDGYDRPLRLNIVGEREVSNYQLAELIAREMGAPFKYTEVDFHSSRPGHDPRYALDGRRLAALGWQPSISIEEGVRRTVEWTESHPEWL